MSNATLESKIERAFQDDVIFKYPEGTSITQLHHEFLSERKNALGDVVSTDGFYQIKEELAFLDKEVMAWHLDTYGSELNKFGKGAEVEASKERYRNDTRFKKAFDLFGVDWGQHNTKIYIPWWNEVGASQISHEQLPDGGYKASFVPMHPFELQLVKRGLDLPVKTTSTLGVLVAAPDETSREGYIVLGVRTGSGHANTYHVVPAGYLQASGEFIRGEATIYDGFVKDEVTPESGLTKNDISDVNPLAIVRDYIISNGGPEYTFLLQSKLNKEQILQKWREHEGAKDCHEHAEFVFVPAKKEAVNDFIAKNYVGSVANRPDRKDSERYILHPAALALASYSGMPLSTLKSYCNGQEN